MTDSEDDNRDDRSGLTGVTSEADVDVSDSDDARLGREIVQKLRRRGEVDVVVVSKYASRGSWCDSGDKDDQRCDSASLMFLASKQRRRTDKNKTPNGLGSLQGCNSPISVHHKAG